MYCCYLFFVTIIYFNNENYYLEYRHIILWPIRIFLVIQTLVHFSWKPELAVKIRRFCCPFIYETRIFNWSECTNWKLFVQSSLLLIIINIIIIIIIVVVAPLLYLNYEYSSWFIITLFEDFGGKKVKFIRDLNLTKNYLILLIDKFGLILKINVSTFISWVSYAPEGVASYWEMGG